MNESFLEQQHRFVPPTDWALGVAVLVAGLYVASRILFPRYHNRIAFAFFNRYESFKLIEEKNVLVSRGGYLLVTVPVFGISMAVLQQMGRIQPGMLSGQPLLSYLGILGTVASLFAGRILAVTLFGISFEKRDIALKFNQMWILHLENLASWILVPSLVLPFTSGVVRQVLLILVWSLLSVWLVFTIVRELDILRSHRVSMFYMFLYLCALEILPLWWAVLSITEGG